MAQPQQSWDLHSLPVICSHCKTVHQGSCTVPPPPPPPPQPSAASSFDPPSSSTSSSSSTLTNRNRASAPTPTPSSLPVLPTTLEYGVLSSATTREPSQYSLESQLNDSLLLGLALSIEPPDRFPEQRTRHRSSSSSSVPEAPALLPTLTSTVTGGVRILKPASALGQLPPAAEASSSSSIGDNPWLTYEDLEADGDGWELTYYLINQPSRSDLPHFRSWLRLRLYALAVCAVVASFLSLVDSYTTTLSYSKSLIILVIVRTVFTVLVSVFVVVSTWRWPTQRLLLYLSLVVLAALVAFHFLFILNNVGPFIILALVLSCYFVVDIRRALVPQWFSASLTSPDSLFGIDFF